MDQNRCLLDVIDNPQLLQSFLESESSAETTNNNHQANLAATSHDSNNASTATEATTTLTTSDSNLLANAISFTTPNNLNPSSNIVDGASIFDRTEQLETTNQSTKAHLSASFSTSSEAETANADIQIPNSFAIDPVGSVLDSIITETVAETSPSTHDVDHSTAVQNTAAAITYHDGNTHSDPSETAIDNTGQTSPLASTANAISTNSGTTTTHAINANNFLDTNDNNNNSTSSSDTGSNGLLVDEFYAQRVPTNINSDDILQSQQSVQRPPEPTSQNIGFDSAETAPSEPTNKDSNYIKTEPETCQEPHIIQPNPSIKLENQYQPHTNPPDQDQAVSQTQQQEPIQQPPNESAISKISSDIAPTGVKIEVHKPSPSKANKSNNNSNVTKTPDAKPKRASRAKKNNKVSSYSNTPSQSPAIVTSQAKPMPTQFMTAQTQQQIIFQTNNGVRQPTMFAPNSMGQPMAGVPQQQRVIQIQTANGPMYFAIAPGPAAAISNPMMQQQQQQQQQHQSGMQSQQYPSQQVCFQPNSNMMLNRPQLAQPMKQQQQSPQPQQSQQQQSQSQNQSNQQHQQVMSPAPSGNMMVNGSQMIQSPQTRLSSPMMAGQTVAISNQQGTQQQMMLPSTQPMMISRMPNQLILNRPQGQLLPGQQQFIQIMTPNGPMLLALPTQQTQPVNNTMVDFNNQVQQSQLAQPLRLSAPQGPQQQQQHHHHQQQQQQSNVQVKPADTVDGSRMRQANVQSPRSVSNAKSGLDLADLLLDCGILPEDKTPSNQSANSLKSQSPSLSQISSPMPSMPQIDSPLPTVDSSTHPLNQSQPNVPTYPVQPAMQQQPIRITFGPDGQMIMQPAMYGAMRPMMTSAMGQPNHVTNILSNNIAPTSIPMATSAIPNSSTVLNPSSSMTTTTTNTLTETSATDSPKKTKGKGTAVKRSRSKKSADIDKFPQLKTPKFAQQQQQQQQQQQTHQQQLQAVTVVPILVGDQNKVLAAGSDVKPNIAQLASGQQVSLAKFVAPVMQSGPLQSSVSSNVMQTSMIASQVTSLGQNQTQVVNSTHLNNQVAIDQGESISSSNMSQQQHQLQQPQQQQQQQQTATITTSSTSHISPSGQMHSQNTQNQFNQVQQHQPTQQQKLARQLELRAQSILNQLSADQNAALHPQTKQSFRSIEDACKRLLRYHVFDTGAVGDANIRRVDEIFEAAVESLITRKRAIYEKFRLLILKQSMKTVPLSEEVMLDQAFVNSELAYIKEEKELMKKYQAYSESVALEQAREDSKLESSMDDCGPDYFAFGDSSPKQKNRDELDNVAHSRDVDDWLLNDKWGESRYPSVPDSEAATAIESILNDEIN